MRAATRRWSWKRDLNTRPADYESAALPTELFQHIHFFHSVCLLRLQLEAQCVSSRLFTLSDNQRPADYESAALPTELFQHIPISVTFYPLRLQPEAQCVPARLFTLSNNQRPADYESAALPPELFQQIFELSDSTAFLGQEDSA